MTHGVRARIVLAFALVLGAAPAGAQNPGLPVYNIGVPRGIGVYGDVAFPNDVLGNGVAYGVTGRAGFGLFGVTATLSALDPKGAPGADVSVGGTLNYRLFGGPLVPLTVTFQGGVSYAKPDQGVLPGGEVTAYRFPVGVGFALVIPNPVLAIRPWLAPRVDIDYRTNDAGSNTDTNFGLSGGLEFNFLNGFGLQAAYDRVFASNVSDPATFAIGAHYAFRVPGL